MSSISAVLVPASKPVHYWQHMMASCLIACRFCWHQAMPAAIGAGSFRGPTPQPPAACEGQTAVLCTAGTPSNQVTNDYRARPGACTARGVLPKHRRLVQPGVLLLRSKPKPGFMPGFPGKPSPARTTGHAAVKIMAHAGEPHVCVHDI